MEPQKSRGARKKGSTHLRTMAKQNLRPRPLMQQFYHLVTPDPIVVVPSQPTLRMTVLVVLADVVHVRGEDPGAAVVQVDDQDAQPGGVAGSVSDVEARRDLEEVAVEGLPIEVEAEIVGKVDLFRVDFVNSDPAANSLPDGKSELTPRSLPVATE